MKPLNLFERTRQQIKARYGFGYSIQGIENHKSIISNLEVRNKVETKWDWINKLVQEPQDTKDLHINIDLVFKYG